jgi:predicted phage terminase large subunit-like protein
VIGVDPSVAGHDEWEQDDRGDECGVVAVGSSSDGHSYVLQDHSVRASPLAWARVVVKAYWQHQADVVIAEANNGGEMVRNVIQQVDERVNVRLVHASRGKYTRAEPVAALYERGLVHHVGAIQLLEDEMTQWVPDGKHASPNRMDAVVWALTELIGAGDGVLDFYRQEAYDLTQERAKRHG